MSGPKEQKTLDDIRQWHTDRAGWTLGYVGNGDGTPVWINKDREVRKDDPFPPNIDGANKCFPPGWSWYKEPGRWWAEKRATSGYELGPPIMEFDCARDRDPANDARTLYFMGYLAWLWEAQNQPVKIDMTAEIVTPMRDFMERWHEQVTQGDPRNACASLSVSQCADWLAYNAGIGPVCGQSGTRYAERKHGSGPHTGRLIPDPYPLTMEGAANALHNPWFLRRLVWQESYGAVWTAYIERIRPEGLIVKESVDGRTRIEAEYRAAVLAVLSDKEREQRKPTANRIREEEPGEPYKR